MGQEQKQQAVARAVPLLTEWYRRERRALPWRQSRTPYHVWLAEIMLQQTRIEAVIPYYDRFLEEFPTVDSLAAAPEERVLKLWEGLGYYSRARNLHAAAKKVVEEHGGRFPQDAGALRRLPGIGEYTAGAVASIAFGRPEPAVDGNVLRVLTRLLAWDADIAQTSTRRAATELLRAVYPVGEEAGLLTEGIMELGERVCIPNGAPLCGDCPVRALCRACNEGDVLRYPVKTPKKARRVEPKTVLLLECGGRFAIQKRANKGLLAGLWELPQLDGRLDADKAADALNDMGLAVHDIEPCGEAKHIFTHVEWHMTGYHARCAEQSALFCWATPDEIREEYAVPTAFRYYLAQLDGPETGGER